MSMAAIAVRALIKLDALGARLPTVHLQFKTAPDHRRSIPLLRASVARAGAQQPSGARRMVRLWLLLDAWHHSAQ